MKLADLVLRLQQLPPDAEVVACDSSGHHCAIRELRLQRAPGPEIQLVLGDQYVPWDGINSDLVMIDSRTFVELDRGHIVALVTAADIMKNGAIPDCIINPFRAALQGPDSACPAAGMKPDACSDRSQCLEACGPLGQIPLATCTVHLPNGLVHACERHASTARLQACFLGTHAYVDQAADGILCTYCATRAGGAA